jgi:hypothetical protein
MLSVHSMARAPELRACEVSCSPQYSWTKCVHIHVPISLCTPTSAACWTSNDGPFPWIFWTKKECAHSRNKFPSVVIPLCSNDCMLQVFTIKWLPELTIMEPKWWDQKRGLQRSLNRQSDAVDCSPQWTTSAHIHVTIPLCTTITACCCRCSRSSDCHNQQLLHALIHVIYCFAQCSE